MLIKVKESHIFTSPEDFIEGMNIKRELSGENPDEYMIDSEGEFETFKRLVANCLEKKRGYFHAKFDSVNGAVYVNEYSLENFLVLSSGEESKGFYFNSKEKAEQVYVSTVLKHFKDHEVAKSLQKRGEVTYSEAVALFEKIGKSSWSIQLISNL